METFKESINQRLTARHLKCFQFTGEVKNKKILDIGCSFGWFEKFAVENGCKKIIGIDTDVEALLNAKNQIKDKRVKFLKGSALDLSIFEKNHFDKVVLWEVLEHLPKGAEKRVFQEINKVLKFRGMLYLSTPNRTFWSCILDPAWWLIGHRHYSLGQIEKLIKKTGFEVEKVEYGGGFYELVSMILLYIFKWIFKSEIPFKSCLEYKRENEYFDYKKGFATLFIVLRK